MAQQNRRNAPQQRTPAKAADLAAKGPEEVSEPETTTDYARRAFADGRAGGYILTEQGWVLEPESDGGDEA